MFPNLLTSKLSGVVFRMPPYEVITYSNPKTTVWQPMGPWFCKYPAAQGPLVTGCRRHLRQVASSEVAKARPSVQHFPEFAEYALTITHQNDGREPDGSATALRSGPAAKILCFDENGVLPCRRFLILIETVPLPMIHRAEQNPFPYDSARRRFGNDFN
jgi:hypothetical protein